MIGITVFLVGSALSGLSARTMWQLILFRGIQGLGAGSLFPISLAVIGDLFTPAERGKYQGLFGAVFGLSALVGPALGGFITDTVGWHWIFYVNIPIGLVSLLVVARVLPTVRPRGRRPQPRLSSGAAVFTAGLVPFLIGLTNKQTGDWTDPQVGGLIVARPRAPGRLRLRRARGRRSRSSRSTCGGTGPTRLDHRHVPRRVRVLRGGRLPAALLPGRPGRERHGLRLRALPAPPRRHRRRASSAGQIVARTGKYKAAASWASLALLGVGSYLMTNLARDHRHLAVIRPWMFVLGLGHRADAGRLHDRRPERGAVHQARRRDLQPDLLPPDRRLGRRSRSPARCSAPGSSTLIPGQLVATGVPQQFVDQFPIRAAGRAVAWT